jgi:hypothetical protein
VVSGWRIWRSSLRHEALERPSPFLRYGDMSVTNAEGRALRGAPGNGQSQGREARHADAVEQAEERTVVVEE